MSTVLILGAGATAGAKGLPVDMDFLQRSSNVINSYDFLPVALGCLYESTWVNRRLEDAWSGIDARYNSPPPNSTELKDRVLGVFQKKAADEAGLPDQAPRYYNEYWEQWWIRDPNKLSPAQYLYLFAGWELRQAICLVYGQAILGAETKYRERLAEYADRGPVFVIDFNHDLYLEEALGSHRWFYYPDASPGGDAVEILKPHGSLNWVHQKVGRQDEEIVAIRDVYPTPSWGYGPEGLSQASIIPMTRAKREFTADEESEAIRSRYGRILQRCEDVLRRAQHICIIGYSFPTGDRYFQDVLRDVRTSRVTPLISLKYIGRGGTIQQWTTKLREVFGGTLDPKFHLEGF